MTVLVIVPCYNEELRLDVKAFNEFEFIDCLFVDDCSTDKTKQMLQTFTSSFKRHSYLTLKRNSGKAEAVRAAMLSLSPDQLKRYEWIGFWDADLATPLSEISHMLQYQSFYDQKIDAILCSRLLRLGSNIKRSPVRHYLSRIFMTLVTLLLDIRPYDSQCGAKLFRPELISKAFGKNFISKWIFDLEVILRLRDHRLIEYPLLQWHDIPGSKLNIMRDLFRISSDLIRIARAYRKNE